MAIFSQRVPIDALPTVDNTSFFKNLVGTVGDAIDNKVAGNLVKQSLTNAQQQQPQALGQPATSNAIIAPNAPAAVQGNVAIGNPNDIQNQFINTVRQGGVTNPNALAAIAATGRAESGWDPSKVNAAWPDPSQSGQAGTAGGILSWRNERLANLRNFAASQGEDPSNISPATQAKFFLQEDPALVQRLNAAKSPQEAADIMAGAWKFAGYDQQGGEAARRRALAQNYYSQQFANAQPVQVASNDPSVGIPAPSLVTSTPTPAPQAAPSAAPTPTGQSAANFDPATVTPSQMNALLGGAQQPYVDPTVTTAYRDGSTTQSPAPAQQAIAAQTQATPGTVTPPTRQPQQPGVIANGITPLNRQNIDPDLIRRMVQNPITRQTGLAIAQQVLGGKPNNSWDFVKLDDGTLARANKQTGAVETLGQFQSGKKELQKVGNALYDASTGQWIVAPEGAGANKLGLAPIYGTDENGNTVLGQIGQDGSFHRVDTGGFKPVGNVTNTNLGTTIVTRDKAGNIINTSPIDVAGKEQQTQQGKNLAANQQALPAVEAASNQLLTTIDSLANDPYLDKTLGPVNSRLPNVTGDSERVQAKKDQITGQTFLQAYNTLRGGGAITDIEGQKATQSLARLNSAQNAKDYRDALNEFRSIVVNAAQRARTQAGQSVAPTSSNKTSTGVTWSVEQ